MILYGKFKLGEEEDKDEEEDEDIGEGEENDENEDDEIQYNSFFTNDDLMKNLACKFAKVHEKAKEYSKKNKDDFAAKKIFSSSSLKFIYNIVKNKKNNLIDCIISVIEDCYYHSYKNNLQKNDFKKYLLKAFNEKPEEELLQYLKNNEEDFEKKYSNICILLDSFKEDPDNINIDFVDFYYKLSFIRFKDLTQSKNKFKGILLCINEKHKFYNIF